MVVVRYADANDKEFWFSLDKHLPKEQFELLIRDHLAYIILDSNIPIGILRYNLFWNTIPFCNLLYIKEDVQGEGYGSQLLSYWEKEMSNLNYEAVMTSAQEDETAQHFYRKCNYRDAGYLDIGIASIQQVKELLFIKQI